MKLLKREACSSAFYGGNVKRMKLDGPKSHDKVFEDDGETVIIRHDVEDTFMKYKSSFCD